jgi:uncharacterized iron-regulated membrane protein
VFVKFNPNGLVVMAVFFGLLWYAVERGVDYGVMGLLVLIALDLAFGGLAIGVIGRWPWPRRRRVRNSRPLP